MIYKKKKGGETMSILGSVYIFEPIPKKFSAIASGATPIGSAERASDRKEANSKKDEELRLMIWT
jgi:hypothetical protein